MTPIEAMRAAFPTLPTVSPEALAAMQARDERACYLQRESVIFREDALAVAHFTISAWAQRYPVRSHDLGKDAALFVAAWLSAHHVGPTADNMDAALQEWQGGMFVARLQDAIARFL